MNMLFVVLLNVMLEWVCVDVVDNDALMWKHRISVLH